MTTSNSASRRWWTWPGSPGCRTRPSHGCSTTIRTSRVETARRVRAAIAELGYRPNRGRARAATGRTQLLGVVALNTTLYGPASPPTALRAGGGVGGIRGERRQRLEPGPAVDQRSGRAASGPAGGRDRRDRARRLGGGGAARPHCGRPAGHRRRRPRAAGHGRDGGPGRGGRGPRPSTCWPAGHRTVWHVSGPPTGSTARGASWAGSPRCARRAPRCRRCSPGTGRRPPGTGWGRRWPGSPRSPRSSRRTTTSRSASCARCMSGHGGCPTTSAWSASTTCPRRVTSSRR